MCRAGGRRCPAYRDAEKIKARNARRRAAYAAKKKALADGVPYPIVEEDNVTPSV